MLALVSLINPIRSFGEKNRLIHILLIATHTQMVAFFSQDGSVFLWKCQTWDGSCLSAVPLLVLHPLVINTALSKPALPCSLLSKVTIISQKQKIQPEKDGKSQQEKYGQHQTDAGRSDQLSKHKNCGNTALFAHKSKQIKWSLQVCPVCTENNSPCP